MTRDEKIKKVKAYLTGERPTLYAVLKPDFSVSYHGESHEFSSRDLAEAHLKKLEKSYNVVKINVIYAKREIARSESEIDLS
jgi:hypothetical protein